jgi:hypothetical protein
MQYLLIDPHKRLLGTFNSEKALAVGDTFQNQNAQFYTVIGLNWFKQRSQAQTQSLTVIPAKPIAKTAPQ